MHEWGRSLAILVGVLFIPMTVLVIGDGAWVWLIVMAVVIGSALLIERINAHERRQKDKRRQHIALQMLIGAREVIASGWVKSNWSNSPRGAREFYDKDEAVDASGLWVDPSDSSAVKWTVRGALAKVDSSSGKSLVAAAGVIGPAPDGDVGAMLEAIAALSQAVPKRRRPGTGLPVWLVVDYADEPETTHADVLAIFDTAVRDQALRT